MFESDNIENKLILPEVSSKWLKSIVAFSNTSGGMMYIGVEDETRAIVGIEDESRAELEEKITNLINSNIEPKIYPTIVIQNIEGKSILVIEVQKGNQPPYYLKKPGINGGVYKRLGSTDRVATEADIKELQMTSAKVSFTSEIYRDDFNVEQIASETEINQLLAKINSKREGSKITIMQLINWKIVKKKESGIYYQTNGFNMLTANTFYNAVTRIGVFQGINKVDMVRTSDINVNLIDQFDQALEIIMDHLQDGIDIEIRRRKKYKLPIIAVREFLANALVHRNYVDTQQIMVEIYNDRLVIISPGTTYDGLSLEDMKSGRSILRNENISEVFYAVGYVEKWGSGIQRANAELRAAGLQEAFIEITHRSVDVTMSFELDAPRINNNASEFLSRNRLFARRDLQDELNLTQDQSRKLLEGWIENGEIIKVGRGRATKYKVVISE